MPCLEARLAQTAASVAAQQALFVAWQMSVRASHSQACSCLLLSGVLYCAGAVLLTSDCCWDAPAAYRMGSEHHKDA